MKRLAFLTSLAVTGLATRTLHTEERDGVFTPASKKLSIYDPEDDSLIVDEEPTPLELTIRKTRHEITKSFASTNNEIQKVVNQWIDIERRARSTVSKFVDPTEKILPGSIYVTLTYFAGAIISKNRGLFTRIFTPPIFALAAFGYNYPGTGSIILSHVPGSETISNAVEEGSKSISGVIAQARDSFHRITGKKEGK
ncbi:hypothetical protein HK096_010490 [Nowakowskiella sp. JEL0078]|nr:hypothetical protein HK096_010490 [Nowakowskiella sp. JEL0078]